MEFAAHVDLDCPFPHDESQLDDLVDGLLDGLEAYGGTVTRTPAGRIGLRFTVTADSLHAATSIALAVATAEGHPAPFAVEVVPASGYRLRLSTCDPA